MKFPPGKLPLDLKQPVFCIADVFIRLKQCINMLSKCSYHWELRTQLAFTYSKSSISIKTPVDVALVFFVVNFEHFSHLFLVFLLLTLSIEIPYCNDIIISQGAFTCSKSITNTLEQNSVSCSKVLLNVLFTFFLYIIFFLYNINFY